MEPWANTATKCYGKKRFADRGGESGKRSRTLKGHSFYNFKEGRRILFYSIKAHIYLNSFLLAFGFYFQNENLIPS